MSQRAGGSFKRNPKVCRPLNSACTSLHPSRTVHEDVQPTGQTVGRPQEACTQASGRVRQQTQRATGEPFREPAGRDKHEASEDGMGGKAQMGANVLTEAAAPRGYLAPTLKNGIQLRRALQPSTELPGCRSLRRGILAGYSEAAKA